MAIITIGCIEVPARQTSVPTGKMVVVNQDPHNLKQKVALPNFHQKERNYMGTLGSVE